MDNAAQDDLKRLRDQLDMQQKQLAREMERREQAEDRARLLTEELAVEKNRLAAREAAMEERRRFDMLLSEISTHFISLPPDRIDSEIKAAQRRICECLGLDMTTLWQRDAGNPEEFILTHFYRSLDGPPVPERMNATAYLPWSLQQVLAGKIIPIASTENAPVEAGRELDVWRYYHVKASLGIPLSAGEEPPFGAVAFIDMQSAREWPQPFIERLQLVAQIFANALLRKQMEDRFREHLQEIEELKQRLENENLYLQREIQSLGEPTGFVGQSLAMKRIMSDVQQVAKTDSSVLILGETGTGKELLARAIHKLSGRKDRPMVTINCASLPPTLIESELFGREKGAYTGAMTRMTGRFEIADGSTLFLDEIGELPIELQGKLLRVLEEGVFERLGSTRPVRVNVRIIAATNRDIEREVAEGRFRRDLFYRLNVFPVVMPPLRDRPQDIPLLVWAFVKEFQQRMNKEIETISKQTMEALQSYSWPGNVRELRNVVEHAMILSNHSKLMIYLPKVELNQKNNTHNLGDMERKHIMSVLASTGWKVGGKGGASEILGLKRSTLYSKMKKLGIVRPGL